MNRGGPAERGFVIFDVDILRPRDVEGAVPRFFEGEGRCVVFESDVVVGPGGAGPKIGFGFGQVDARRGIEGEGELQRGKSIG